MTRFINAKYYPLRVLISIFILMLLAGTSLSATYYVKNGGSDGADGLSDASAWASISKVNNKDLSAGDIVLFKRDSTWSDTLIPKSSGSAVSPIVFGAYGTGAVPVININYNSSKHRDLYVNGKSNIQIRDLAFLNGTSEGATLYGNVEINNSSSIVLENIVVSGSFCKTAVLIANSSHDISVRNSTVEMTSFPGSTNAEGAGIQVGDFSNFNTCYNVVITGCDVKNNSGAGIVIFESYQNSVFENNVHGNGSAGIWVGGASGSYSHDNIIEKNRVYENCQYQDDAFGIDLYRVGNNNAVRYNLVHDQYDTVYNPSSHTIFNSHLFGSGGIRFDGNNTMSTLNVNGNIAHNNIVYNEYQGFQVIHINNVQIFNNTIYNNKTYSNTSYSSTGISVLSNYPSVETHTSNTIVKNNAVYGKHWMVNDAYSSGTSFNNNVYFCTYDGTHIYFSHDGSGVDTFAGWKSATGYDSLSTFADPSFEAAGTNFRLRSVSQAINAGTVEGISVPSSWTDYAGTSVPQGARPDVGAYEYSAPVVTGTVKVSGSGAAIQWAGVYLLNANSELVSYAVTDSSGNFTIDAASMEGYLFVSPPTSQNGQGYWVYQYQPRFYYKPAASNSGIDIRLPQASTFIIEGRDLSNNLMDVASFEALRANVFSQYISFVNVNDQIQPAMYWQVTNSDGRAIPALMIDSSQTGGPFAVNVLFWQTASHGKIMLKADNDGSGFALPSAGQATIINLNTELLKTVKKEMVNRTSHYNTYISGDSDISLISSVNNLDDAIDLRDRLEYKAAQAAINVIRKGSVELTAKDLSGNVLQNCTLEVVQTSHQFMFGAFAGTSRYAYHTFEGDVDRKYSYNKAIEAGLGDITAVLPAWSATAGLDEATIDQTLGTTSLKNLGYQVKFHGTLWFNLLMIPAGELSKDPATIAADNRAYQNTILGYFGDTDSIWETMNEPATSNEIGLSREAMISVLADSSSSLKSSGSPVLVNSPHEFDYGFKYAQYNLDNTLRTDYKLTYSDFLSRANIANIDIIGLQFYPGFHMDPAFGSAEGPAMPPYWLVDTVNRYSAFGKDIHITEFSVPSGYDAGWKTGYWKNEWDAATQAEYVDRIFTLMYGTASVDSIIWWDMLESESYLKYGGLLDTSKNAKPAYDSVKNLIKGSWTTTGEATTANNGKTTVNGFGGRYSVSRIKLGQATTIENPGITFYVTEESSGTKTVTVSVYSIAATSGVHGSITPSGQVCVVPGGSRNFVITPEAGYRISDLKVDGISVGTPSAYSFTGLNSSHTIEAVFAIIISNYVVTSSSNSGGAIVPNGAISVASGESQSFVITPESGYYIVNVSIDGINVGPIVNYTFSNVTGDHSISATFNNNWARIYYVDSSSGSNTNTGTSETKAWQAISKVNEMVFRPGDSVKFRSGQTFAGSLNIYQSGTAFSPITFDAYSAGAKPVIDAAGQQMGINMISASNVHIKNLEIKNATHPAGLSAGVAGNNSSDIILDALTVHDCRGLAGIYFYDANTRITVKNSLVYNTKAVSDDARYAGIFGSGILMGGTDGQSNSNYHHILNNTSYNNANVGISAGNGSNNTISGNSVYNNGDCGIGLYGSLSSSNIIERNTVYGNCQYKDDRSAINLFMVGSNNIVRYNKTHSQYDTFNDPLGHGILINTSEGSSYKLGTCGIRFDGGHGGFTASTGNIVHTNLITGEGDAFQVYNFANTQFFNNTVYNSKRFGVLVNGSYATNAIVKNNIISTMDGSATVGSYKHLIMVNSATSYYINNNLYFPDGATMFNLNETKTNFSSWKASQRDINSVLADPKFASVPSADFALQNTSSAIDLGTTEGLTLPSPWQDITGSTVPYAGTRPDAGAYESSVAIVPNTSPVMTAIGSKTTNEAQTLAFTVSATDSDGDTVTYEAASLPSGATFNTTSGAFSWMPTYSQSGTYNPTFIARDGQGGSTQEAVTITVTNVNRAPVLTRIGSKTTNEAQTLTFTVSGTDEDGSALTYTMTGTPSGASFNTSTRIFIWMPSYSQSGSYTVTFEVSDGSLSSSETVGITVNNVPRTFVITAIAGTGGSISPSGSVNVTEGNSQAFTITGNAGYSISNVLVDGSSQGAVGTYTFSNVTAVHTIEASFSMTLPSAPSVVTASAASVSQINVSWTDNANNEDGYRIQRSPNGTSSWTTIGTVGAVTSYNDTGLSAHTMYYYRVYSYNGSGVSAYSNTANATTLNSDPSLIAIGNKTTNEAQTLIFTVSATDADSDTVTYEAVNLPTGATFNTTSGAFSWVPSYSQSGAYSNVTFKARDIYDGLTQETITITVTNVLQTFIITASAGSGGTISPRGSINVTEGISQAFSITANTGYDILNVLVDGLSQGTVESYTFSNVMSSHSIEAGFSTTTAETNEAPVAYSTSVPVTQDASVAIVLSATDADGDSLEYIIVSGPSHGMLSGSGANRTYTPASGYFGADLFTFKANDGVADSNTSEITITVVERSSATTEEAVVSIVEPAAMPFTDITSTVIAANWTGGSNPDGTLYYCENVTAGTNSGWITSTKFISRGLSSEQTYEFRVKAKNTQGSETAWISLGSQKTKGKRRFKSVKAGDHKLLPGDIVSSKLQLELEIDAEDIEIEEVNIYVDGIKTSGAAEIKKAIKVSAVDEIDIKYVPEQTLTLGEHSIRIEALDTAGDVYEESISGIKVLSSDNKAIQGAVLPYPNPYDSNAGELKVSYTLTTDMDIAAYIFDITGKLVSKREYINGTTGGHAGYNEIAWDGKDIFGSKVDNDIYLIRIVDKGTGKLLGRCKVMVLKK